MTLRFVRPTLVGALILAAGLTAADSFAQTKPEGRAALVQKLTDCRKLAEDPARLACYDAAAADLEQAEAKGDIVVVDREQARTVRRQAFGFSLPSLSVFDRGDKPEDIDRIEGVIARAHVDGAGKWVLQLEDGGAWAQIDVQELSLNPKAGQKVVIRKATLGSFLASVEGRRAFRVRRIG